MTQDELARVPSGGAKFKLGIRRDSIFVFWGKNEMLECYSESAARQIVGSVNAAIILNQMCSNWTNINWDDEKLSSPEVKFWLDYAKGSA